MGAVRLRIPCQDSRGLLRVSITSSFVLLAVLLLTTQAAQARKPNILVIFGDDVRQTDISAYSRVIDLNTAEELRERCLRGLC